MLYHQHETLVAADGHDIHTQLWAPEGQPSCVIQILHGLGEHGDRYARFAAKAVERGFAVCVHDHRGHGKYSDELGHFAGARGWQQLVSDSEAVNDFVGQTFAGTPVILLVHSMGSYVAQAFAMQCGSKLSGLILSASTWPSRAQLAPAKLLARIEAVRLDTRGKSKLLDKLGFGNFNKPFEPARTERDWLSRDEAEVDKYVSDPLCGGPYSCGLWLGLLSGLFHVASDKAISSVPLDLPILISGGESDPVGGDRGMTRLAMHYAQTLHQRIKVKIYADGRHEMLNETNRDEVTADWLDWVLAAINSRRAV
jgi:alpha-beta hydrolase superfamily lysophospholipase